MPWERGAWERTARGEAAYEKARERESSRVRRKNYGYNSNSRNSSSSRQINKNSNKTNSKPRKNGIAQKMDSIVSLMRNGDSLEGACRKLNISSSTAREWYNKGWFGEGNSKIYKDFYHKVSDINASRERSKKTTKKVKTYSELDIIRRKMQKIISSMRSGKSRHVAASNAGVTMSEFNRWYDLGESGLNSDYVYFYKEVSKIENKNKSVNSSFIACSKCGNLYNKNVYLECPNCRKNKTSSKSKLSVGKYESTSSSDWTRCSKCGRFYKKSMHSQCPSCNKSNSVQKSSAVNKSNVLTKCSKCGEFYKKSMHSECPNCKKGNALSNVNYCQNCGKKISSSDLYYCSECGASLKDGKKVHKNNLSKKTKSDDDKYLWGCLLAIFIIFFILLFLSMF